MWKGNRRSWLRSAPGLEACLPACLPGRDGAQKMSNRCAVVCLHAAARFRDELPITKCLSPWWLAGSLFFSSPWLFGIPTPVRLEVFAGGLLGGLLVGLEFDTLSSRASQLRRMYVCMLGGWVRGIGWFDGSVCVCVCWNMERRRRVDRGRRIEGHVMVYSSSMV